MATKKSKAAKAETRTRNPIPFAKIANMYAEGKTMKQIAKAVNRYNAEYPDPTKSVRAIISLMITKGYTGDNGKTVHLKKRNRVAASEARKPTGKASGTKGKRKATKGTRKPQNGTRKAPEAEAELVTA